MLRDHEKGSVKYGCFLVIPLNYDPASVSYTHLTLPTNREDWVSVIVGA